MSKLIDFILRIEYNIKNGGYHRLYDGGRNCRKMGNIRQTSNETM